MRSFEKWTYGGIEVGFREARLVLVLILEAKAMQSEGGHGYILHSIQLTLAYSSFIC